MPSAVTSLLAGIVVLGVMILVHEWGHFIAAKLFGVRVNVFSFGFGPRIWGWERGHTDYRLSALPFGGYVKMAGDNPTEERAGAPDEFLSKSRWQRVMIAVAGPAMNFLLAIGLMIALYMVGAPEPAFMTQPAVVAGVLPGTPAEQAGIRPGDRVVQINRIKNPTWDDALFELAVTPPGGKIPLVLERKDLRISTVVSSASPRTLRDESDLLGYPQQPVLVGIITPGMPADKAGLRLGDEIISANGQKLLSPVQFAAMIRETKGAAVELGVNRDGTQFALTVHPIFGDPGDGLKRWEIGIGFGAANVYKSHSLPDATRRAVWFNVRLTRQIFQVLAGLFQGRISLKQLGGPVDIAHESGQAARRGPLDFLNWMAVISLNLGVLNLLPIPILDGGHVLLLAIEGMLRRDLSLAVKERFVQVSLVFLLAVIAFVTYYDVLKLLPTH